MKRPPIPYTLKTARLADLVIGYRSPTGNRWDCRPYENRPGPDHPNHAKAAHSQHDYDRLEASIREHGISDPLIVWPNPETGKTHVLIGMRRAEIGKRLGIETVLVAEVQEDVSQWTTEDVRLRQEALKRELGQREY